MSFNLSPIQHKGRPRSEADRELAKRVRKNKKRAANAAYRAQRRDEMRAIRERNQPVIERNREREAKLDREYAEARAALRNTKSAVGR